MTIRPVGARRGTFYGASPSCGGTGRRSWWGFRRREEEGSERRRRRPPPASGWPSGFLAGGSTTCRGTRRLGRPSRRGTSTAGAGAAKTRRRRRRRVGPAGPPGFGGVTMIQTWVRRVRFGAESRRGKEEREEREERRGGGGCGVAVDEGRYVAVT